MSEISDLVSFALLYSHGRSIYEALGRGKHSVVYKGRKKKSVSYYAIKSVEKSQKSRVLQEVRSKRTLMQLPCCCISCIPGYFGRCTRAEGLGGSPPGKMLTK